MLHTSLSCRLFSFFRPDPNILLFRRPLGTDGTTGQVNPELAKMQREQFRKQYGLEWIVCLQYCAPDASSVSC